MWSSFARKRWRARVRREVLGRFTSLHETTEATSEIEEYLSVRQERRKLFPSAVLVGLAAGALAVGFRIALAAAHAARNGLVGWAHQYPHVGWLVPVLFGAVLAAASVWLVRRTAPEAAGSGIPHLEGVLHRLRELRPGRLIPVKFMGGILALGSGMALGREGPSVQLGGALGAVVSDRLGRSQRDRMTLIAAGAGAGLAAAFNAPLAGLIFVLEEVQRDFRPLVFGATFIAAAVATALSQTVSGPFPVFEVAAYPVPPTRLLGVFVVVGLLCGGLGAAFNRTLVGGMDAVERIAPTTGRAVLLAATVGAAAGLVAWFSPDFVGGGHEISEVILDGNVALTIIPLLFLLRFVLTIASYGTGAPGGIFAPLLVLGALVGLAVGEGAVMLFPTVGAVPGAFAVVGMAAFFASVVRAPLTGIVLIVEMTGSYALMLPLLVACFCAYLVAEGVGSPPIYESLARARPGEARHQHAEGADRGRGRDPARLGVRRAQDARAGPAARLRRRHHPRQPPPRGYPAGGHAPRRARPRHRRHRARGGRRLRDAPHGRRGRARHRRIGIRPTKIWNGRSRKRVSAEPGRRLAGSTARTLPTSPMSLHTTYP